MTNERKSRDTSLRDSGLCVWVAHVCILKRRSRHSERLPDRLFRGVFRSGKCDDIVESLAHALFADRWLSERQAITDAEPRSSLREQKNRRKVEGSEIVVSAKFRSNGPPI
jgi:hypothetical protein